MHHWDNLHWLANMYIAQTCVETLAMLAWSNSGGLALLARIKLEREQLDM